MSQFAGLPKSATSAPKVPPSPSAAAASAGAKVPPSPSVGGGVARASPRGNMAGFKESTAANDPMAPSIRIADADIEYVRGKGGATHTYSQGESCVFV